MSPTKSIFSNWSLLDNVQILTVDNDRDSGALYTALFEIYGVAITTTESVKGALEILNRFTPDILICETNFSGESIYPLIQKVRDIAQNNRRIIPIFVTSTYPVMSLAEHLKVKVEAYHIKPIDLDRFVHEVWSLVLLSKTTQPFSTQAWSGLNIDKIAYRPKGVAQRQHLE